MSNYSTQNETLKKRYEEYLELDEKLSESTVYSKIKALRTYEAFTNFKDFSTFNKEQGLSFKEHYRKEAVSHATLWRKLENIKEFFKWLSAEPQYRRKINARHLNVFNLSKKEENTANSTPMKDVATLEQLYKVIHSMPADDAINLRNRAMVAFTLVSGIRVNAMVSLKLKHIDEYKRLIKQNPSEVNTKFSKYINTWFFPVDESIQKIVLDWVEHLKEEKLRGLDTPLFPAIQNSFNYQTKRFEKVELTNNHIQSTTTVRTVFKEAFKNAGMPYFNPHSFRDTLIQYGERICTNPETFKAWSQNIGHSHMLTTFTSYGNVHPHRQGEIIKGLGNNLT
jgi:integrase